MIVVATAVVASPWYIRQAIKYGNPVFDRPDEAQGDLGPAAGALLRRARPAGGLHRSHPPALPQRGDPDDVQRVSGATTSASGAGAASGRASSACCRRCSRSPAGSSCSLRSLRSPPRLAVALLPGLGLLGYLYFTVSYPTPDGDVLKASYMLTTAPAWALAFGYARRPPPRARRASRSAAVPGRLGARSRRRSWCTDRRDGGSLHVRGAARRHRQRVRRAGATTVAADVEPLAPALYHADRRALVPRIDDPGYVPALRALVRASTTCG